MRTIARHKFLLLLRRRERQANEVELEAAEAVWAETHTSDGGNAYLAALGECLEGLQGKAKQVVDMYYREHHGRAEIAAQLDMTADGIKSLLRRTRDALRECVETKVNRKE